MAVKTDERPKDTDGSPLQSGISCPECGLIHFYDTGSEPPAHCRRCKKPLAQGDGK